MDRSTEMRPYPGDAWQQDQLCSETDVALLVCIERSAGAAGLMGQLGRRGSAAQLTPWAVHCSCPCPSCLEPYGFRPRNVCLRVL